MNGLTEKIEVKEDAVNSEFDSTVEYSNEYYERYVENFEPNRKKRLAYRFFKRFFDITASLLALIVSSPFLLVIAIAVKCDSKGGILLSKSGSVKTEKLLIVINLDQ